ncbi:MAG: hypothetical protein MHM6MM_001548, partial [Cercozoa sp. M6MM]
MTSLLELEATRQVYAEMERQLAECRHMLCEHGSSRSTWRSVLLDNELCFRMKRMMACRDQLLKEIEAPTRVSQVLSEEEKPMGDVFAEFYENLRELRKTHSASNSANEPVGNNELEQMLHPPLTSREVQTAELVSEAKAAAALKKKQQAKKATVLTVDAKGNYAPELVTDNPEDDAKEDDAVQGKAALARQELEALRLPRGRSDLPVDDPTRLLQSEFVVPFSGPEQRGAFLEMTQLYTRFVNTPCFAKCARDPRHPENKHRRMDYATFLDTFWRCSRYNKEANRKAPEYKQFLQDVLEYLSDWLRRSRPLFPLEEALNMIDEEYRQEAAKRREQQKEQGELACSACDKTFANSNVYKAHMKSKKHLKRLAKMATVAKEHEKQLPGEAASNDSVPLKLLEFRLESLGQMLLRDVVRRTIDEVHKRQTRSAELQEAERVAAQTVAAIEEEEEVEDGELYDNGVYNPKKVPLDVDGTPIPYWLYILHGLNRTFSCEICGDQNYRGPREFEYHFHQQRHTQGLRALGIQNTKAFEGITKMADALQLWQRM